MLDQSGDRDGTFWDVRIEFDSDSELTPDVATRLTASLRLVPGVRLAVGFLSAYDTHTSIGATIVIAASNPGEGVSTATALFADHCARLPITLTQIREATVTPADLDPRA